MIYSDGFSTISAVAILYAKTELGASQMTLLIAGVIVPLAAGVGSFVWPWLQAKLHLTTRQIIMIQAFLYTLFPIYCLLFLRSSSEIWPLSAYHGFLLGATQSSCRVLFSELIPQGLETEFFSLYEITDKGSAWVGPLVVGLIGSLAGLKNSFYFLATMLGFPIVLLYFVNDIQGKQDAHKYVEHGVYDEHSTIFNGDK